MAKILSIIAAAGLITACTYQPPPPPAYGIAYNNYYYATPAVWYGYVDDDTPVWARQSGLIPN